MPNMALRHGSCGSNDFILHHFHLNFKFFGRDSIITLRRLSLTHVLLCLSQNDGSAFVAADFRAKYQVVIFYATSRVPFRLRMMVPCTGFDDVLDVVFLPRCRDSIYYVRYCRRQRRVIAANDHRRDERATYAADPPAVPSRPPSSPVCPIVHRTLNYLVFLKRVHDLPTMAAL